jgi:hypothetical protein
VASRIRPEHSLPRQHRRPGPAGRGAPGLSAGPPPVAKLASTSGTGRPA